MSEPTPEGWIQDAAIEITRHVKTARSPAFQSTAEYKIEEAHKRGCAAVSAERERCLDRFAEVECNCGISDEMKCGRCHAISAIRALEENDDE